MNTINWTTERVNLIKQFAGQISDVELLKLINSKAGAPITLRALRAKRQRLGIIKNHGQGNYTINAQKTTFRLTKNSI